MAARESLRESVPPTRILEEKESDMLDALVDLSITRVNEEDLNDLQDAVRKRKTLWESYSTLVTQLVPKLEQEGRRAEAADVRKRLKDRRQAVKSEIRNLNLIRTSLEDVVSSFSLCSTEPSEIDATLERSREQKAVSWREPVAVESDYSSCDQSLSHEVNPSHSISYFSQTPPTFSKNDSNLSIRTSDSNILSRPDSNYRHIFDLSANSDSFVPVSRPDIYAQTALNTQSLGTMMQETNSKTLVSNWLDDQSHPTENVSSNINNNDDTYYPIPEYEPANALANPVSIEANPRSLEVKLNAPSSSMLSRDTIISTSFKSNPLTTPFVNRLSSGPKCDTLPPSQSLGADKGGPNRCGSQTRGSDMHGPHQSATPNYQIPEKRVHCNNTMDTVARFLLQKELEPTEVAPFTGESHKFHSWLNKMHAKIDDLPLSYQQKINIFESNTKGEPQKLIRDFQDICLGNPEITFHRIMQELQIRYGSPESIYHELNLRLAKLPPIKDGYDITSLRSLLHLCRLIQCNLDFVPSLTTYDTPSGLKKIWHKLPYNLRDSWTKLIGDRSRRRLPTSFSTMVGFLEVQVDNLAHSQFYYAPAYKGTGQTVAHRTLRTDDDKQDSHPKGVIPKCYLHKSNSHPTKECKAFRNLSFDERVKFVKDNKLCFACLGNHYKKDCTESVECNECKGKHTSAMHDNYRKPRASPNDTKSNTDTPGSDMPVTDNNSSLCTRLCGTEKSKSCSKVLLVEVWNKNSSNKLRVYALLDEQSSASFLSSKLADRLNVTGPIQNYSLTTLSGCKTGTTSMEVSNLVIKGVGEAKAFPLPKLLTNDFIPNCKDEIGTSELVSSHSHIKKYAKNFNAIDDNANVHLLLGRDCNDILKTTCYGNHYPYVHHTAIGWALVGSACPNASHSSKPVVTLRTTASHEHWDSPVATFHSTRSLKDMILKDSFATFQDDELPSPSADDKKFLQIVEDGTVTKEDGSLEIPLPFKDKNPTLPDNRAAVYARTYNTLQRLKLDTDKLNACIDTLTRYQSANHAEIVPRQELTGRSGKVWYLPIFPVTHPKKGKIRLVFDSSAKFNGTSLNDTLLQGPDNNNTLKGVLLRFRNGPIAISCDVEMMFHSFKLPKEEQDFVRFFFFRDLDPKKEIVEYRMKTHCFGNTASPAVANFGLRTAASASICNDMISGRHFILDHVYVDDGLAATDTVEATTKMVKEAREILSKHLIRLHKITSNSKEVLDNFPETEIAECKVRDIEDHNIYTALGMSWDVTSDDFLFHVKLPNSPFTKRGVLSVVNSVFDPLGIVSPVILTGRLYQRQIFAREGATHCDWDDPLPSALLENWNDWKQSLTDLPHIKIPRSYYNTDFGKVVQRELHVFCDASQVAIGHVSYLRLTNADGRIKVSFVTGNARVTPKAASTIPRLELCAALEAVIATTSTMIELKMSLDSITFHCDSMVVLGYLNNVSKSFSRYVARRVELILSMSKVSQWNYVQTSDNPADVATHPQSPTTLLSSKWFTGPNFLSHPSYTTPGKVPDNLCFPDPLPESDSKVLKVSHSEIVKSPVTNLCERVSSWSKIIKVTKIVLLAFKWLDKVRQRLGILLAPRHDELFDNETVVKLVIKSNQKDYFTLNDNKIPSLTLYTDSEDLVRVGGRLKRSFLPLDGKCPYFVPPNSHLSNVIVRHFHVLNFHQGRVITLGAVRGAGFHIVNCKKLVDRLIKHCPICQKLRGRARQQLMSDLPPERLEESPPFTNCGIDLCGPFNVKAGPRTRRVSTTKKVWAALFTCLVTRAVHIEMVASCDTASFLMAIRRFFCIRGTCNYIRTDNAGNFLATRSELNLNEVTEELESNGCKWITNNPKASHEGGVWERKIRSIRSILDASLLMIGHRTLEIEELNTVFQEAAAVVNSTPLYPVSCSAGEPTPITPAMLLTLKDSATPLPFTAYTQKDMDSYGRNRWKRCQLIADEFWKRWRRDYLPTLQQRHKWKTTYPDVKEGDVVLLMDKVVPRNQWPTGIVESVRQSSDSLVRSAVVRVCDTSGKPKLFNRSIRDLVVIFSS